jgi:hypothetical protein
MLTGAIRFQQGYFRDPEIFRMLTHAAGGKGLAPGVCQGVYGRIKHDSS